MVVGVLHRIASKFIMFEQCTKCQVKLEAISFHGRSHYARWNSAWIWHGKVPQQDCGGIPVCFLGLPTSTSCTSLACLKGHLDLGIKGNQMA